MPKSAIDSLIGNKNGSTSLVPLPDLARQLAGLGVEGTDEWLLAQKFAENPEDDPVLEGQFSSLHHAKKSEFFAGKSAESEEIATNAVNNLFWYVGESSISVTVGVGQSVIISDPGPGPYDTVTLEVA